MYYETNDKSTQMLGQRVNTRIMLLRGQGHTLYIHREERGVESHNTKGYCGRKHLPKRRLINEWVA